MEIKIEQNQSKGAAYIEENAKRIAEMTYSVAGTHLMIIDHTEIDDSHRGKGLGKNLLMALVEKARKEEIKIIPLCPFAKSVFDKDESIQDVLK
ncbi:MAG: GNAT family N-acetyltransferase [Bacteroidota bacterium]